MDFDVLTVFEDLEVEDLLRDLPRTPDFEILDDEAFVPFREVLALVLDCLFEEAPLEDDEDFAAASRLPDVVPFAEETLELAERWPLREFAWEETFRDFLEWLEVLDDEASLADFREVLPLRLRLADFVPRVPDLPERLEYFELEPRLDLAVERDDLRSLGTLKFGTAPVAFRAPGLCSFFMIWRH